VNVQRNPLPRLQSVIDESPSRTAGAVGNRNDARCILDQYEHDTVGRGGCGGDNTSKCSCAIPRGGGPAQNNKQRGYRKVACLAPSEPECRNGSTRSSKGEKEVGKHRSGRICHRLTVRKRVPESMTPT